MSGFSNPIANRIGELIRQALQSDNFVAGVSGWIIRKDGTAEFNNTTIRGSLIVTDPDGSYVKVFDEDPGDGAVIDIRPADTVAGVLTPGRLIGSLNGSNRPYLQLRSPQLNGAGFSQIQLYADELGNQIITLLAAAAIQMNGPTTFNNDINCNNATVQIGSLGLLQYAIPTPGGILQFGGGKPIIAVMYYTGGTGATSAGAAEAALVAWTGADSVRFVTGKKYSAEIGGGAFTSTAAPSPTEVATIRLRTAVNSLAAQVLGSLQVSTPSGASVQSWTRRIYFKNTSGANVDKTSFGITVARAAGAGNSSVFGNAIPGPTGPLYCIIRDEGYIGETLLDQMMIAIT